MKLILCRHGETEYSLLQLCTGQTDIELTAKGRLKAYELGELLQKYPVRIILSSPLIRARETTAELIKTIKCEVEYHHELQEQNFGSFEGKRISDYFAAANKNRPEEFKAPEGESFRELKSRVLPFVKEVVSRFDKDTVVMVTHGSVIRAITSALADERLDQAPLLPSSYTILELNST